MSINVNTNEFIKRKRELKVESNDNNLIDYRKTDQFNDNNLNVNLRSSDIFADPNISSIGLNFRREAVQGPLSQVYNSTSGFTPKYNNSSDVMNTPIGGDSFFQSSKGIFTPLSPGYTPKNNVAFYNHSQNQNLKISQNQQSPIAPNNAYVNQTFAEAKETKANYKSEVETTNSETSTPSKSLNEIKIPDISAPKLQNIVSTVNLKCALELRDIALKAKNAEFNPKRFAAVIMRIREPKTTALIFSSGKMVCTGARSEEDSRKASRQYAKIIQKLGYQVKFSEFKIQNIVGSSDVRFPIRLEGLAASHSKFCSYEPEMFPGLIYKMASPKIVLLIFVSGKIVLTGAKERSEIFSAFEKIYPVLLGFKKKELYPIDEREIKSNSSVNEDTLSTSKVQNQNIPA